MWLRLFLLRLAAILIITGSAETNSKLHIPNNNCFEQHPSYIDLEKQAQELRKRIEILTQNHTMVERALKTIGEEPSSIQSMRTKKLSLTRELELLRSDENRRKETLQKLEQSSSKNEAAEDLRKKMELFEPSRKNLEMQLRVLNGTLFYTEELNILYNNRQEAEKQLEEVSEKQRDMRSRYTRYNSCIEQNPRFSAIEKESQKWRSNIEKLKENRTMVEMKIKALGEDSSSIETMQSKKLNLMKDLELLRSDLNKRRKTLEEMQQSRKGMVTKDDVEDMRKKMELFERKERNLEAQLREFNQTLALHEMLESLESDRREAERQLEAQNEKVRSQYTSNNSCLENHLRYDTIDKKVQELRTRIEILMGNQTKVEIEMNALGLQPSPIESTRRRQLNFLSELQVRFRPTNNFLEFMIQETKLPPMRNAWTIFGFQMLSKEIQKIEKLKWQLGYMTLENLENDRREAERQLKALDELCSKISS